MATICLTNQQVSKSRQNPFRSSQPRTSETGTYPRHDDVFEVQTTASTVWSAGSIPGSGSLIGNRSWTLWCTPGRKRGRGSGGGEEPPESQALATSLWSMLYADDAGVVSHSPEQLRKMMGVMVVVCATFGLTVSGANAMRSCVYTRTNVMPEDTAVFSVGGAQLNERVRILRGNVNHNANLPIEVDRRIRNAWCSFQKYTLELYDRPSAPLELETRMLRAEVLETRVAHSRAHTTCGAEPTTASLLAASVGEITIVPTTRFPIRTPS